MIKIFQNCPTCKGTGTIWFRDENGELDDDICHTCCERSEAIIELCNDAELNTYELPIMEAKLELYAAA